MFNIKFESLVLLAAALFICAACSKEHSPSITDNSDSLNIGWQTLWSPSGQIAQTLIHTDIAKKENLHLNFVGFMFGPDMNEAAINHNINCLNTGNVPATSLLSKSNDWIIIARLIRQPLAIVARNGSGIIRVKDLAGKTIGVPYGSGPHPYLLCLLQKNALWDGNSQLPVKLINVAPSEQMMALQQKEVDAIATWEPQTAIAVSKKLGTIINEETSPGFIIINKTFAKAHPDTVIRLLKAYLQAEYYVATHKTETDSWFAQASHFSNELISKIHTVEPNMTQRDAKKIDLNITAYDLANSQAFADKMYKAGLIRQAVNIKERIDLSYLQIAQAQWLQQKIDSTKAQ